MVCSHPAFTPDGSVTHKQLIAALIKELFLDQRRVLTKWTGITNQSAQLDSGYIAQHLISLLTGIKGIRRRGKGLDLSDGSEVKCQQCGWYRRSTLESRL